MRRASRPASGGPRSGSAELVNPETPTRHRLRAALHCHPALQSYADPERWGRAPRVPHQVEEPGSALVYARAMVETNQPQAICAPDIDAQEVVGTIWMLKPYIIYFKYKNPGDKKTGPVRQFRIYADGMAEARRLAVRHANYPNIEVLEIKQA